MTESSNLSHTRNYIRLFQMQLHGVLEDMATPAEVLSSQFSESLLKLYDIREHVADDNQINRQELLDKVQTLISEMFECVSSMQFVDAKRQRIEHVADGLSYLIETDDANNTMKYSWDQINTMIVEQFKMDKERNIYQKYLQEYSSSDSANYQSEAN